MRPRTRALTFPASQSWYRPGSQGPLRSRPRDTVTRTPTLPPRATPEAPATTELGPVRLTLWRKRTHRRHGNAVPWGSWPLGPGADSCPTAALQAPAPPLGELQGRFRVWVRTRGGRETWVWRGRARGPWEGALCTHRPLGPSFAPVAFQLFPAHSCSSLPMRSNVAPPEPDPLPPTRPL